MAANQSGTWIRKAMDLAKLPRIKLNNIKDLPGATKNEVRVGRGPGSGRGKTSGRGHKGQGQRNKRAIRVGFEGGQTPFYLRVPKRGFTNIFRKEYTPLNLSTLQWYIDQGRISASQPINMKTLKEAGFARKFTHGVKLLSTGSERLVAKVDIEVSRASKTAIEAVEAKGGRIVTAYYNRLGLRVLLTPEKFEGQEIPRRALPSKHDMAYYLDPAHRGYLLTKSGQQRLKEGGMEGAYLAQDGRVAIPGKRTTLYTKEAPAKAEAFKDEPLEEGPPEFTWR